MRIFLMLFLLLFSLEAKSLFSNREQADASKYIDAMKDLIIATQKTRGLTNSFLNGNESALLLIHGNRNDMKRAIGVMESLPISSNAIISSRATDISQALVTLNNKAFKQEPAVTFDKYTEQIEQMLMLAQTLGKQTSADMNPFAQELSGLLMENLLPFTEQVGRMRGMGSGIVAKKAIDNKQKFAIMTMISDIDTFNGELQSKLSSMIASHKEKFDPSVTKNLTILQQSVSQYVSLTKADVLTGGGKLDPNEYFDKGTDIISTLVNIYDSSNKAIMEDSKGWF